MVGHSSIFSNTASVLGLARPKAGSANGGDDFSTEPGIVFEEPFGWHEIQSNRGKAFGPKAVGGRAHGRALFHGQRVRPGPGCGIDGV